MPELIEMHAILRGRVQGVGFRQKTYYLAQELGLKGTVENLFDGSVEIYAQGKREQLDCLLKSLYDFFELDPKDPKSCEFAPIEKEFETFSIIH